MNCKTVPDFQNESQTKSKKIRVLCKKNQTMITLGEYNQLRIDRILTHGAYLLDDEGNDVLLPTKYLSPNAQVGDEVDVFIYTDSEDRLIATNLIPKITLNEFAFLRVKDVNQVGAFMDWGLEKDLLIPFNEQNQQMEINRWYVVRLFLDEKTNRLVGSNKLNKFLETNFISVVIGEKADLIVTERVELGFQVIINHAHRGLVYSSETFRELNVGDVLTGYIKNIREDGKIDVSLQKQGYVNVEPSAQKILELLQNRAGFIALNDKSEPEAIYAQLQMSKKTFKKAIGGLYKKKLIRIEERGIFLQDENEE